MRAGTLGLPLLAADLYLASKVVMALYSHGLCSYGRHSRGLYSHGLYGDGLYSHGLCSYGLCDVGLMLQVWSRLNGGTHSYACRYARVCGLL